MLTEDGGLLPHEELARTVKRHWRLLVAERTPQIGSLATAHLQESIQALVSDLSLEHDPRLVRDALARVAQQQAVIAA